MAVTLQIVRLIEFPPNVSDHLQLHFCISVAKQQPSTREKKKANNKNVEYPDYLNDLIEHISCIIPKKNAYHTLSQFI